MNELSIIRNLITISKKSDNVYHLTASVQYKNQNQKPKQSSSNNQKKNPQTKADNNSDLNHHSHS